MARFGTVESTQNDLIREYSDDFLWNALSTNFSQGSLGMQSIGTASSAYSLVPGSATNIGLVQIGYAAGSGTYIGQLRTSSQAIVFGAIFYRLTQVFSVPTLPTSTEGFTIRCGFWSSSITVGAFLMGSSASANWQAVTSQSSGATTIVDTGIAMSTDFLTLNIEINKSANKATFYINGSIVAVITSNIPTDSGVGIVFSIAKTSGTSARAIVADFVRLRIDAR